MSNEAALDAARNMHTFYLALFDVLTEEVGKERASTLQTKMLEELGAIQGKMARAQSEVEEFSAETAFPFVKTVPESLGMTIDVVEASPEKVVIQIHRCPIYEAGIMMGQDPAAIEAQCTAGPLWLMDAFTKQFNPNLSYRCAKYRSGSDGYCQEEIVLS